MSFFLCQILVVLSIYLRLYRKFIGFILFLVYVGGLMILVRYCVMLIPSNKFLTSAALYLVPTASLVSIGSPLVKEISGFSLGLLYSYSSIYLVAILLYLVILAIVEIVGYSRGIIKF